MANSYLGNEAGSPTPWFLQSMNSMYLWQTPPLLAPPYPAEGDTSHSRLLESSNDSLCLFPEFNGIRTDIWNGPLDFELTMGFDQFGAS